jgi:hypothetical protein
MVAEPAYASQEQVRSRSISPNQNEIALVPYAKVGEEWSLPDEFILALAVQMKQEGVFHKVFYDGLVVSPEEFLAAMQRPGIAAVFFFDGHEPIGFAWLNGFVGGLAFVHFCGLRAARGKTLNGGRLAFAYWMKVFTFLSVILGVTPANNKLALRYIKKVGMTVLGEIPNVLYDAYEGEKVAAVLSYYSR